MPQQWFPNLQRIGKALMVPVAVLPAAGLLLGLGTSPLEFFPDLLQGVMLQTGTVIFQLLPMLFAIALALSFCYHDGSAAIAAVIGYGVLLATMSVFAQAYDFETQALLGFDTLNTGVIGGVLSGGLTALVYRRFYRVELPEWLAFFSGRRLVPMVNVIAAIALGALLSQLWPWMEVALEQFSHWVLYQHPKFAWMVYGMVERLLIPLGLHHIWNVPFFYEVGQFTTNTGAVIQGEVGRFLAGDPSAGHLAGGYFIKVWGLPAAALAMWRSADTKQQRQTAGVMLSAALTCAITGVTEPVEFAFLFVAPLLYLLHAVLTGLAYLIAINVEFHHGLVFSQGLLDFSLFYHLSRNTQFFWILGPFYAGIYFLVFRFAIMRFNLPTPGRTSHRPTSPTNASQIVTALGGRENLLEIDACLTRLRMKVKDVELVQQQHLIGLGAKGVVVIGKGVQVVFGPKAERLRAEIMSLSSVDRV